MPELLVDIGETILFWLVLSVVVVWYVCALFDSAQPLLSDNSESDE